MIIGVAGPYSAPTEAQRKANLDAMNAAAARLLEMGHVPVIGMNAALPVLEQADVADRYPAIMAISLAVIGACDALLLIAESPGEQGARSDPRAWEASVFAHRRRPRRMIIATTPRLVLRDLEEDDRKYIFLLNNDPEVLKYVHDVPFKDLDAAREWIANIKEQLPLGIGRWAIAFKDGTWIGRCSLRQHTGGEVLMGYRLLRPYSGKGYATEAARAMLDLAFNTHQLSFVFSKVARENVASQRVMEKNGGLFWKEDACGHFADAMVYRFDRPVST